LRFLGGVAKRKQTSQGSPRQPASASVDPEVLRVAIECFGNRKGAISWLTQPAFGLAGKIPRDVAKTAKGRANVLTLLKRIDYGIPP
jgi:uncharacterized protein (DUF2384 family)